MPAMARKDYEIGPGDTLRLEARWRVGGVPVDLSKTVVRVQLAWFDTSKPIGTWEASTVNGAMTADQAGRIRCMVPADVIAAMPPRAIIRYSIIVLAGQVQQTILGGVVRIRR